MTANGLERICEEIKKIPYDDWKVSQLGKTPRECKGESRGFYSRAYRAGITKEGRPIKVEITNDCNYWEEHREADDWHNSDSWYNSEDTYHLTIKEKRFPGKTIAYFDEKVGPYSTGGQLAKLVNDHLDKVFRYVQDKEQIEKYRIEEERRKRREKKKEVVEKRMIRDTLASFGISGGDDTHKDDEHKDDKGWYLRNARQ